MANTPVEWRLLGGHGLKCGSVLGYYVSHAQ
jgi:hypothetical protein